MAEQAVATFEQTSTSDELVVVVNGELDAASAGSFADAAYRHIGTSKQLVLDLESASFMDSSGLKVLATVAVARAEAGGVLVRKPCQQIRKLLNVAGMSHFVTVEPALDQPYRVAS